MRRQEVHVPAVDDVHPYGDAAKVPAGAWATYRVGASTLTLSAVGAEGGDVWIEVVEEGEPRQVSARRVGPDGRVVCAYYRCLPSPAVYRQVLKQSSPGPGGDFRELRREARDGEAQVEGRAVPVKVETVTLEDLDGRRRTDESWWSPQVPPIYAGSPHGGLVRRGDVELLRFGTGAQRLVTPP